MLCIRRFKIVDCRQPSDLHEIMNLPSSLTAIFATVIFSISAHAQQVAITEFFANPRTLEDDEGEFVELFNYGTNPVNLNGWTISDEGLDSDLIAESDLILAPGSYLVIARNKAALEAAFFGGLPSLSIVEVSGLTLGNSADEIVISDAEANVIWSVAYPNGEGNGNAAFLSEDNFSTTTWGSTSEPGISFTDIDPASGTLGYQNNITTTDPNATTVGEDTASPLAGFYTIGGSGGDDFDSRILSIVPGAAPDTYDITFISEEGESYALDFSEDLTEGSFSQSAFIVADDQMTTVTSLPVTGSERGFFRVREGSLVVNP